ncbi:PREDICTED: uncharacterized protein LOC109471456 [Branchiostoma belcheri]|uniref:Uncharacterized protein LOC109471456 n=1 Tax=Branchiostoma belcheri TaxID=7741 RepID=A0A6P4Z9M4_BRABE|nr:PREDICTED: uncharacterized protein LOC109471456 [Branchiostoma belcheri]
MASELKLLKSNREELVGKIRLVTHFLDRLLQHDEIVQEEYDNVVAEKTPQDKARALLDVVAAKGRGAFCHFREHLKKVNPELEEVLNRCAKHNLPFKLYCEDCGTLLCRACRSKEHKDHRCTSLVAEGDAIRRQFTAFKRENRKILIERNKMLDGYDVEIMRREADDRAEVLKEGLCAKVDEERRWFFKQLGDGPLSPARSASSIADSGSVAGSEANDISDAGDQTTKPLSFSSTQNQDAELHGDDDDKTCVTEDQATLCDELETVHLDADDSSDMLEDVSLPYEGNTRNGATGIQTPRQSPTVDFLHSFGVSGRKEGQFRSPDGMTICPKGRIIVADKWNHRVQLFDINGTWESEISTRKWGSARPSSVVFCSLSPPGDVLVTCTGIGKMLQLSLSSKVFSKLSLAGCRGVAALDGGRTLFISEQENNTVHILTRAKNPADEKVAYNTTNKLKGPFYKPQNVNTDGLSNIYVSDIGDRTVKVLDKEGYMKGTIGKDILRYPTGVCVDKEGNIIVSDMVKNTLEIFASDGHHLNTLIPEQGGLKAPQEIALTPDGTKLVVVDRGNDRVRVYRYNQGGEDHVLTNKDIRD